MKSKTPHVFWLRWIGVSSLHALAFSALWMFNLNFLFQWRWAFIPINLVAGITLALLQYWAMSPAMRPSPKRWFPASFLGFFLSVSLHAITFFNILPNIDDNLISRIVLLLPIFLPPAIAQSWALRERFRKSWLFGLSYCLPILIFLSELRFTDTNQILIFEIAMSLFRASLLVASLSYLQKFQSKESSSFDASHERLAIREETSDSEELIAEQKLTFVSRSNEL